MEMNILTEFLDSLVSVHDIPGVDCAVLKDGHEIYRHSAGFADVASGKPIGHDTLYYLYSASKVITCTAALQLYEKGMFILEEPLGDYLPEFSDMKKNIITADGKTETVKAERKITVGDLFSMTAGISYDFGSSPIREVLESDPEGYTTERFIKAVSEVPLLYEPGERWSYGLCHDVIGRLIEVISEMTFGEYLRRNLFEPLGMNDTCFRLPPEKLPRLSKLYIYDTNLNKTVEMKQENRFQKGKNFESGGAGLISSVDDYSKFVAAMSNFGTSYDGVRILGKNTVNLMRTNRLSESSRAHFTTWRQNTGFGYGLGVRTALNRGEGGFNCSEGSFGWGGAAGVYVHIDPDAGIAIFYAQHRHNNLEAYVHPRLRNIVYSCL